MWLLVVWFAADEGGTREVRNPGPRVDSLSGQVDAFGEQRTSTLCTLRLVQ